MDVALFVFLGAAGLVILVWFARYVRSVFRGDDQRDRGSLWFIPGSGTHGAPGGQSSPIVPHNPDWEQDRRIR